MRLTFVAALTVITLVTLPSPAVAQSNGPSRGGVSREKVDQLTAAQRKKFEEFLSTSSPFERFVEVSSKRVTESLEVLRRKWSALWHC